MFARRLVLGLAVWVAIPTLAGEALAGSQIGQYLVSSMRGDTSEPAGVWNPTDAEAIAVGFNWNAQDEDNSDVPVNGLAGCDYVVVPSKGQTRDWDELDEALDGGAQLHRGFLEVLSVPSSGKNMGKIKADYGVGVKKRSPSYLQVMNPKKYKRPETSVAREQVRDCICDALDDAALPGNLFKNFGYNCD